MNELGLLLKTTRESSGVSLNEASNDLNIKENVITNIENGNIGCFKDIFVLKDYIRLYSKYLGLDPEETINDFNEYLFEYTSRIPVSEIEKKVMEKNRLEAKEKKIASPYTKPVKKTNNLYYLLIYILLAILIIIVVIWSIKQVTM